MYAASLAIVIVCFAAPASAEEPVEPATARHGWKLGLTGYMQVDSIAWSESSVDEVNPATGDPLNQERFLIRRGRLRADASRDGMFGLLELDGNTASGPTARIIAAQVGWSYVPQGQKKPLLTIGAGLFKTPFGVEVPSSDRDKPFLDSPAFARALFPGNYDAGIMAQGGYGPGRWVVALVNGAPVGDTQWRGKDPSSSYDLLGRVGVVIEGPQELRLEAGVSALTGSGLSPGSPATAAAFEWVDANQDGVVQIEELQVTPGAAAVAAEKFDRRAFGGDLQVHWCLRVIGNGNAFAELALARNLDRGLAYADPVEAARDLRELGFALGFDQNVGDHAQLGGRYDRYRPDRDGPGADGDRRFSTLAIMVAGTIHEARIMAELDHDRTSAGAADRVTLRAQVGF